MPFDVSPMKKEYVEVPIQFSTFLRDRLIKSKQI
jgi:hypothetical protein